MSTNFQCGLRKNYFKTNTSSEPDFNHYFDNEKYLQECLDSLYPKI